MGRRSRSRRTKKKPRHQIPGLFKIEVRTRGVEPPRPKALPPEDSVSTIPPRALEMGGKYTIYGLFGNGSSWGEILILKTKLFPHRHHIWPPGLIKKTRPRTRFLVSFVRVGRLPEACSGWTSRLPIPAPIKKPGPGPGFSSLSCGWGDSNSHASRH